MYDTLAEKFDKLLSRYVAHVELSLKARLVNARDKEAVAQEINSDINHIHKIMVATPTGAELINDFYREYNRGDSIDDIINSLQKRYGLNLDAFAGAIKKPEELQIYYSTVDGEYVSQLASDKRKLLKCFVQYMTVQQIKVKFATLIQNGNNADVKPMELYPVKWTGNRDNKNEFVQLVYALHRAGYINHGQGEITKIVESLAATLNVALGKSWQSNLSSSVHKSKNDYEPPVFEKIKKAYLRYADELIMAKKTNK